MSIGARLTLFLVLPLTVLSVLIGLAYQQQSASLLRTELRKEGRAIALVVQIAAEDYLRDRQMADLKTLVDRITGYERVLGLRLFDSKGDLSYQSSSLESLAFEHRAELLGLLADGKMREMRRTIAGQAAVGFIFPLRNEAGQSIGAVQVIQLESYMKDDAHATAAFILGLILAMVATTVLIVMMVTRFSIVGPIEELARHFRDVGAGATMMRVPIRGRDELAGLATEFNGMCERLETTRKSLLAEQERRQQAERHLRNADRLASLGRLAAGVAHEIGTPLNVISGRTDALLRDFAGHEIVERHLRIVSVQIDRIVHIVRDMLDFARMKPPRRQPVLLSDALRAALDLLEVEIRERGVCLKLACEPGVAPILADDGQLQQVFLNVALNALDAMGEGGTLGVSVRKERASDPARRNSAGPCLVVTFEDTGPGIPPEDQDHVFDPFFTTKPVGKGTGLGLSISYGIIEEHGGWFTISSRSGHGTRVAIHFPIEELPCV